MALRAPRASPPPSKAPHRRDDLRHAVYLHGDERHPAGRAVHCHDPRRSRRIEAWGALAQRSPSSLRQLAPGRRQRLPEARESRTQSLPSTSSASKARIATPVSTIAIVSASAGQPSALKAPVMGRSRASCSTGVRVRSGVKADLAKEDPVGPGIGRSRMWIAWVPKKRSERSRKAPAESARPLAGRASTSTQASRGQGTRRRDGGRPSPAQGRVPIPPGAGLPRRPSQPLSATRVARKSACMPCVEPMLCVQLADAGALQRPAGVGVGEGRGSRSPESTGNGAFAVISDRHRPAVLVNQFAVPVRAFVADVQREEAHPSTGSAHRRFGP